MTDRVMNISETYFKEILLNECRVSLQAVSFITYNNDLLYNASTYRLSESDGGI